MGGPGGRHWEWEGPRGRGPGPRAWAGGEPRRGAGLPLGGLVGEGAVVGAALGPPRLGADQQPLAQATQAPRTEPSLEG